MAPRFFKKGRGASSCNLGRHDPCARKRPPEPAHSYRPASPAHRGTSVPPALAPRARAPRSRRQPARHGSRASAGPRPGRSGHWQVQPQVGRIVRERAPRARHPVAPPALGARSRVRRAHARSPFLSRPSRSAPRSPCSPTSAGTRRSCAPSRQPPTRRRLPRPPTRSRKRTSWSSRSLTSNSACSSPVGNCGGATRALAL